MLKEIDGLKSDGNWLSCVIRFLTVLRYGLAAFVTPWGANARKELRIASTCSSICENVLAISEEWEDDFTEARMEEVSGTGNAYRPVLDLVDRRDEPWDLCLTRGCGLPIC
jgi:hypothetical protein